MKEEEITPAQLLSELVNLRRWFAELEQEKENLGRVQEHSSPPGKEGRPQGQGLHEGLV